jgi:hypothetical protein
MTVTATTMVPFCSTMMYSFLNSMLYRANWDPTSKWQSSALHAGRRPGSEYWSEVIPAIKKKHAGSCSSPRPTGTWSGNSSSKASTFATTRKFMTSSSVALQRASPNIYVRIFPTNLGIHILSASVELRRATGTFSPHFQPSTNGWSSPRSLM